MQIELDRLRSLALEATSDIERLSPLEVLIVSDVNCSVIPVRERDGAHVLVDSASDSPDLPCDTDIDLAADAFRECVGTPIEASSCPGGVVSEDGAPLANLSAQTEAAAADAAVDVEVRTKLDRLRSLAFEAMPDTEWLNKLEVLIVSDVPCSVTPVRERGGAHVLVDSVDNLHDTTPSAVATT